MSVAALMDVSNTDILCLQETRATRESATSLRMRARALGLKMHFGKFAKDKAGKATGTLAVLARWPVTPLKTPRKWKHSERVQFAAVHCPGESPLIVCNVHLPHDALEAEMLLWLVRAHLAMLGTRSLVLGDLNATPDESVVATVCAAGDLTVCDTKEEISGPTDRPEAGKRGRHIDYGLGCGLNILGRQQYLGPADHDLICYKVQTGCLEKEFRWPRHRALSKVVSQEKAWVHPGEDPEPQLSEEELAKAIEEEWEKISGEWWGDYLRYAREGKTDEMLMLLSHAGEVLLGAQEGGQERGTARQPLSISKQNKRQSRAGSPILNQLRALQRAATGVYERPQDPDPRRIAAMKSEQLAVRYPSLAGRKWIEAEDLTELARVVEAREEYEGAMRLQGWQNSVLSDDNARSWIRMKPEDEPCDRIRQAIHPQARAEQERDRLAEFWLAEPPPPESVDPFIADVKPTPGAPRRIEVDPTGRRLKRRAQQQKNKSGGADGWLPKHMHLLPEGWYAALALLWNTFLSGSPIPKAWCNIRVVLIPKFDGTDAKRPLGVAAFAWRLGMGEVSRLHREWLSAWLDQDVASGPYRSCDDLVERLVEDAEAARVTGSQAKALSGCKMDLSKWFDRGYWKRAIRILLAHGASVQLAHVIEQFYTNILLWVEVEGRVSPRAIKPTCLFVQGCAGSVMLALAEASTWIQFVRKAVAGTWRQNMTFFPENCMQNELKMLQDAADSGSQDRERGGTSPLKERQHELPTPPLVLEMEESDPSDDGLLLQQSEPRGEKAETPTGVADAPVGDPAVLAEQNMTFFPENLTQNMDEALKTLSWPSFLRCLGAAEGISYYDLPPVKLGAFFDDRTLWAIGELGPRTVQLATFASRYYDLRAHFPWNASKGQVFSSNHALLDELVQRDLKVGDPGTCIDVVGVHIGLRADMPVIRPKAIGNAERELTRIRLAITDSATRGIWRRLKMVKQLIVPKICWGGQWMAPPEAVLLKWARKIQDVVHAKIQCRSPAIAYASLGTAVPEFAVDLCCIQYLQRKVRRWCRDPQVAITCGRLEEVLHKWSWKRVKDRPFQFDTPRGRLDLGWDGPSTIKAVCMNSWRDTLWQHDNRANDDCTTKRLREEEPALKTHLLWALEGNRAKRRAALGATLDYRASDSVRKGKFEKANVRLNCTCNCTVPSRRHWLWGCPDQLNAPNYQPRGDLEAGLGVKLVKKFRNLPRREEQEVNRLANQLKDSAKKSPLSAAIVAADGGVHHPRQEDRRVAAWGVSVWTGVKMGAEVLLTGHSGPVTGLDQTSTAAELAAALVVLRALVQAQVLAAIWIDNAVVARRVDLALQRIEFYPAFCPQAWEEVKKLGRKAKQGSRCYWIPAHGRHESWLPPLGLDDYIQDLRALNQRADDEATKELKLRWKFLRKDDDVAHQEAELLSSVALQCLVDAEYTHVARWTDAG